MKFFTKCFLLTTLGALLLPSCGSRPIGSEIDDENLVTVTFDTVGGSYIAPQQIEKGSLITKPEDPTINYGTFEHWYYVDASGKEVDWLFDIFTVNSDLTLTASYTMADRAIKVTTSPYFRVGREFGFVTQTINNSNTGHSYFNSYDVQNYGAMNILGFNEENLEAFASRPNFTVLFVYEQLNGKIMTLRPTGVCQEHFHYYIKSNLNMTSSEMELIYQSYDYFEPLGKGARDWLKDNNDYKKIADVFAYCGDHYLMPVMKIKNYNISDLTMTYTPESSCDGHTTLYANIYICLAILTPYLNFDFYSNSDKYEWERTTASQTAIVNIANDLQKIDFIE